MILWPDHKDGIHLSHKAWPAAHQIWWWIRCGRNTSSWGTHQGGWLGNKTRMSQAPTPQPGGCTGLAPSCSTAGHELEPGLRHGLTCAKPGELLPGPCQRQPCEHRPSTDRLHGKVTPTPSPRASFLSWARQSSTKTKPPRNTSVGQIQSEPRLSVATAHYYILDHCFNLCWL